MELETIQFRDDLTFHVPPAQIVDRSVKQLQNKIVQSIKVAWGREGIEDYTWELELDMKKEYPELFSSTKF